MSDRLVTLATFPSAAEAAIARGVLSEAGIQSQITGDASVWALSQMIGNVRLIVLDADAQRAEQLLDEALGDPLELDDEPPEADAEVPAYDFAENPADCSPAIDEPAWTCPSCTVRVAEKERHCWSCGTSRAGDVNPFFIRADSTIGPPPETADEVHPELAEQVRSWIDHGWRAAWLSPILLPPLANFYSAWLLLHAARHSGRLPRAYNRKFYGAFAINLVVTAVAIVWWAAVLRP